MTTHDPLCAACGAKPHLGADMAPVCAECLLAPSSEKLAAIHTKLANGSSVNDLAWFWRRSLECYAEANPELKELCRAAYVIIADPAIEREAVSL